MKRQLLIVGAWLSLLSPAVARAQHADHAAVLKAAREIIATARYATLVTLDETGQPRARVVDPFAPDSALTIWVATNPLTRKVADVRRDGRVTLLYFAAADQEYVALSGTAEIVSDAAEKQRHWKSEWAPFYEGGPTGDNYLLIRIRPERLEISAPKHGIMNDARTWLPVIVELP